jgi:hypothetical protein
MLMIYSLKNFFRKVWRYFDVNRMFINYELLKIENKKYNKRESKN